MVESRRRFVRTAKYQKGTRQQLLTLLHSDRPKLTRVLVVLSAIGLKSLSVLVLTRPVVNTEYNQSILTSSALKTQTMMYKLVWLFLLKSS